MDTIYALSTGQPPAAIAILRISGPAAHDAVAQLIQPASLPEPRRAALRILHHPADRRPLDEAMIFLFAQGRSATGEKMAELHCHGGRAVVAAVKDALRALPRLREAEAGEFTRRALEHGRMDLNSVEGLGDLLSAETEAQRRSAMAHFGGAFSAHVDRYRNDVLALAACVESLLDFSDEGDVADSNLGPDLRRRCGLAARALDADLAAPSAERLRDGIRVVIAGPVNSGKSTLLNRLTGRDAAIVTDIEGTTRDLIEVPVAIDGIPILFVDTTGARDMGRADAVERIGMARAADAIATADILLWLGDLDQPPRSDAVRVLSQIDRRPPGEGLRYDAAISAITGAGMDDLVNQILSRAALLIPREGQYALSARQRHGLQKVRAEMQAAGEQEDLLLCAEHLRNALCELDALTGRAGTEDMLDTLFSRFCIGK